MARTATRAAEETKTAELHATLNDGQRLAATAGDDPLLIIAGAGTGKTTTLAHRVAHLLSENANPGRILLLTFTRRSAEDLKARVGTLLAQVAPPRRTRSTSRTSGGTIHSGTFHSIATQHLRMYGDALGLDKRFTILDRGDAEDMISYLRAELDLGKRFPKFPQKGTCLSIHSYAVNADEKIPRVLARQYRWLLRYGEGVMELLTRYEAEKKQRACLDYDDLLLRWAELLEQPEMGPIIRSRYDHILVDEFQDTNVLQGRILYGLCPAGRGLTVVGDDAQSIYSFRAATVRNILDFPSTYAKVQKIALEQNYRSRPEILDTTNAMIALAKERFTKNLWSTRPGGERPTLLVTRDEFEQAREITRRVVEAAEDGLPLREQAILFRASHHSASLEVELAREGIPFRKYGGMKFVESAHVKDTLAFLRLSENPGDVVAAMRVLMLLPGVGEKGARQIHGRRLQHGQQPQAWAHCQVPKRAAAHWPAVAGLLDWLERNEAHVEAQLRQVLEIYGPLGMERYDDYPHRADDLEQLAVLAGRYVNDEDTGRSRFLSDLALDPPERAAADDRPEEEEDYLVLSTIHSAKGLEWDVVYVLNVVEGAIPHARATGSDELEEERRLLYVAMTRARDELVVGVPSFFMAGGTACFGQVSPFLTPAVLKTMNRVQVLEK